MARQDRDPPKRNSNYANTAETRMDERPILESPTGTRAPTIEGETSVAQDEIREKSVGTRPVSDKTNFHLSGTGGIETDDGLDERSEMARHAAEDIPDEGISDEPEGGPVFDKADKL
ncbi:hypothetical protein GCM10007276_20020 [Agaricicola taiwanensis]|uniref:Uncharacterized protein n=1 Tax=Agaricicola taiwanensis TaxID=591372 RepID=A0A8J2YHC9_9RHOB|nr:hypothetical protein [Agaricicola taiwanensis]GGE42735.1 hypothetical protein GCM10007276_20020 [Agaricicola taiwanensis]